MELQSTVSTLVNAQPSHLTTIMTWLESRQSIIDWGGPNIRYPFSLDSLIEDINLQTIDSLCLVDENTNLLAFGQCYKRLGRCHLGRLIVSPNHRGQGRIKELIDQLIITGSQKHQTPECSLFVFEHNISAITAYLKYGFKKKAEDSVFGNKSGKKP